MRTGAMTALGAQALAARTARCSGHIGARGTAYWNVRLLDRIFDFDEIRVHSRRPESRDDVRATAVARARQEVSRTTGRACVVAPTSWSRPRGSKNPTPLLKTDWIKQGALVVPYGTMSAVELSLTDIMEKIVVDDWGQCKTGLFGALRRHVETGKLTEKTVTRSLERSSQEENRARDGRRDHPLLASRPVALRYRARSCDAGQGETLGIGRQLRYA